MEYIHIPVHYFLWLYVRIVHENTLKKNCQHYQLHVYYLWFLIGILINTEKYSQTLILINLCQWNNVSCWQFVLFKGAKQTQTEKWSYLLYKLCIFWQFQLYCQNPLTFKPHLLGCASIITMFPFMSSWLSINLLLRDLSSRINKYQLTRLIQYVL